jgi:hypothetical protein
MDDMHEEIPKRIRERGVKLLETIALVETGLGDEDEVDSLLNATDTV